MKYAVIKNGVVDTLYLSNAPEGAVQVADGVFAGFVQQADGSFAAPAPSSPTVAQQAAALIAGGLTVTSTATPALNGTYTVASRAPFGREDIATEAQFVSTFAEFTNGTTTLTWPLANGSFVTFPTTSAFMDFAKAAAIFYAACQGVSATGQGALPSASVTIP